MAKRTRARRPKGDSSVWERGGIWYAQVDLGKGSDGKRRLRRVQARTQKEAVEKLHKLRTAVATGALTGDRITVAAYLARWLEAAREKLRATTAKRYEGVVRVNVAPHIGTVALDKLTPLHIQAVYGALKKAGLSSTTIRQVHAVLHRAFRQAVRQGYMQRNPCDAVDAPSKARHEMRTLTAAEVKRLEAAAVGAWAAKGQEPEADRLAALYVLAVRSGMRQGELLGLKWADVALKARTLMVRRSLEELNGEHRLVEPKTKRGRRIDLDDACVRALLAHKAALAAEAKAARKRAAKCTTEGKHDDAARASTIADALAGAELVFVDEQGGPLRKSNLHRRSWKPLLVRAGLPHVRFHDLRHTHATLALEAGINPKIVQERLGHASIVLTLDTYSHVGATMQRDAADKVGALLA